MTLLHTGTHFHPKSSQEDTYITIKMRPSLASYCFGSLVSYPFSTPAEIVQESPAVDVLPRGLLLPPARSTLGKNSSTSSRDASCVRITSTSGLMSNTLIASNVARFATASSKCRAATSWNGAVQTDWTRAGWAGRASMGWTTMSVARMGWRDGLRERHERRRAQLAGRARRPPRGPRMSARAP